MKKLTPANYCLAATAIRTVSINHLFARSVIEQKVDGSVYVDDPSNPTVFYVAHPYRMSLLFGNPNPPASFLDALQAYLLNTHSVRQKPEWLQVYPEGWSTWMDTLLGLKISRHGRVNFQFKPDRYREFRKDLNWRNQTVVRTDEKLYDLIEGAVVPQYFWRDRSQFLRDGVGYTVVCDGLPASTAYSAFMHEPELEIGIETRAAYQGKGLAQLSCAALIDYALENGFTPVWACRADNLGSHKLACKLGFEPTRTLAYYQLIP